jgi:hypothetical protein
VFGPSPYPGHYPGHEAPMISADFCPRTPCVTTWCAAIITVGFGGNSTAFTVGLSPTPVAIPATPLDRYPRIRTFTLFNRFPSGKFNRVNFPYTTAACTLSPESWALVCCATLPFEVALYAISIRRLIALHSGFLRALPHGNTPRHGAGSKDLPFG